MAGAFALTIALVLTLQGLIGQIGQSRMAADALDPLHALCLSAGIELSVPSEDPDGVPHKKAPDCPCATLCRLAATGFALLVLPPQLAAPRAAAGLSDTRPFVPLNLRIERGLIGQPRAPPLVS